MAFAAVRVAGQSAPTLIVGPKLFMVGEENPPSSPQPTVNNFAAHRNAFCEQTCRRPERARGHAALDDELPTRLVDELAQSFAPARRLDS